MLSKVWQATDNPDLARTVLKSHMQAVSHLLKQGYLFEAILHVFSIPGPDVLVPYQKMKADEDGVLIREIQGSKISLDLNDEGISTILSRWGSREEQAVSELRDELHRLQNDSDGDVTVLECGANIGYYAFIEASELGDQTDIYAVEPDPRNLELLSRGIEANGYGDRIRVIQGAFGNETRDATLNLSTKSNCSRIEAAPEFGATGESITVDMYAVDEFLIEHDLAPEDLDVVRMDVEGYEAEILEGMAELLNSDSSLVMFIELHRRLRDEGTLSWTVETLREAGFECSLAVYEPRLRDPRYLDGFDDLLEIDWGEKENIELVLTR